MAEAIGLKVDDPRFWDPTHAREEVDRIFDICWSCRLCFKFCGSFPTLFELIDKPTVLLHPSRTDHHFIEKITYFNGPIFDPSQRSVERLKLCRIRLADEG